MAINLARVTGVVNGGTVTLAEIDLETASISTDGTTIAIPFNYPITLDPATAIILTCAIVTGSGTATACIGVKEDLI